MGNDAIRRRAHARVNVNVSVGVEGRKAAPVSIEYERAAARPKGPSKGPQISPSQLRSIEKTLRELQEEEQGITKALTGNPIEELGRRISKEIPFDPVAGAGMYGYSQWRKPEEGGPEYQINPSRRFVEREQTLGHETGHMGASELLAATPKTVEPYLKYKGFDELRQRILDIENLYRVPESARKKFPDVYHREIEGAWNQIEKLNLPPEAVDAAIKTNRAYEQLATERLKKMGPEKPRPKPASLPEAPLPEAPLPEKSED